MTRKEKGEATKKQAGHEKAQPEQAHAKQAKVETDAQEALKQAEAEIEELKGKLLRAYAEIDNTRKRARKDVEDASRFAGEKFTLALLDVVDNLERALDAEHDNADALKDGVQLTLNSWHEIMRKFGVERIDAEGLEFDPHLHEALAQTPSDIPSGRVISQHVAGYTIHGRLLRPARVIVSGGTAETSEEQEALKDDKQGA